MSICRSCKFCKWEGNGKDEPFSTYCWEDSDNFETEDGCYHYEEAEEDWE